MAIEEFSQCPGCEALRKEVEGLRLALEHRDVIGQAKGILMATGRFTADQAFAVLVAASQRENRKVYVIAEGVAGRHRHLEPVDDAGTDQSSSR